MSKRLDATPEICGEPMSTTAIGAVQWRRIRKRAGDAGDDASAILPVAFKDNGVLMLYVIHV